MQPAEDGGDQDQIAVDTVLMTRWQTLSSTTQEALVAAAVFREKPHVFSEAAWAAVLAADRLASATTADALGKKAGELFHKARIPDEAVGLELAGEPKATQACQEIPRARTELMRVGLLEQPVPGEPNFTLHLRIATFLRSASMGSDPDRRSAMHRYAASYFRGWVAGFQGSAPAASSPFTMAFRFENQSWLGATADLCYHLREAGDEAEAVLRLTTLYLGAFWWWGWYIRYPFGEELLRVWRLTPLGHDGDATLKRLRRFAEEYPVIDLDRTPPAEPKILPADYEKTGRGDLDAVQKALNFIRTRVLEGPAAKTRAAEADRGQLRMLTAIFLAQASRYRGQADQAARYYEEALTALDELGEGDQWSVPYVRYEVAELQIADGKFAEALATCGQAMHEAVDEDIEQLGRAPRLDNYDDDEDDDDEDEDDDDDIDYEVVSSIWRVAADAHWAADRLADAWRCHAWACFHACAGQLWPLLVLRRDGQRREGQPGLRQPGRGG